MSLLQPVLLHQSQAHRQTESLFLHGLRLTQHSRQASSPAFWTQTTVPCDANLITLWAIEAHQREGQGLIPRGRDGLRRIHSSRMTYSVQAAVHTQANSLQVATATANCPEIGALTSS